MAGATTDDDVEIAANETDAVHQRRLTEEMLNLLARFNEMSSWTCREVLLWFIDMNWLCLLDDFKDVSGAHLMGLDVEPWLANEQSDANSFPLHISDAPGNSKINQLKSLAYELKRRRAAGHGAGRGDGAAAGGDVSIGGNSAQIRHGLNKWGKTVNIYQTCHKREALFYGRWATIITVVVVALNALIGGAIFSTINDSDDHSLESPFRILAAVLSLTAGIASAVRSALRLETVSEQHASAARRFAKLYVRFNDMSHMLNIDYTVGKAKKAAEWQDWFKDYMDVMEQAPMVKDALYDKVRDDKVRDPMKSRQEQPT